MIDVAAVSDIRPGGLLHVEVAGAQLVIGNVDGEFFAIGRRCGHMNAPLEMGVLSGWVLTCGLHCAQFDIRTGQVLADPPPYGEYSNDQARKKRQPLSHFDKIKDEIRACSIASYAVEIQHERIFVLL